MSLIVSCASVPDYRPIVDKSNIKKDGYVEIFDEEKYANDYVVCSRLTDSVDYSDEKNIAALKGAADARCRNWGRDSTCFRRSCNGTSSNTYLWRCYGIWRGTNRRNKRARTKDESYRLEFMFNRYGYKVFSDPNTQTDSLVIINYQRHKKII